MRKAQRAAALREPPAKLIEGLTPANALPSGRRRFRRDDLAVLLIRRQNQAESRSAATIFMLNTTSANVATGPSRYRCVAVNRSCQLPVVGCSWNARAVVQVVAW